MPVTQWADNNRCKKGRYVLFLLNAFHSVLKTTAVFTASAALFFLVHSVLKFFAGLATAALAV